jgi:hypothetical protein
MSKDLKEKMSKAAKEMKHPDENGSFIFYFFVGFILMLLFGSLINTIWQFF